MSPTDRFNAAQQKLVSTSPVHFTLYELPSIGWWKAKLDLNLPAIAFIHHYQSVMGTGKFLYDGLIWDVHLTAVWQATSGITPKQWEGLKSEVGINAADLLSFSIRNLAGDKATAIRPTTNLLKVFGVDLSIYDTVTKLDMRLLDWSRARKKVGPDPLQSISDQEWDAVRTWAAIGGMPRLWNAGKLAELLNAKQIDTACRPEPHFGALQ